MIKRLFPWLALLLFWAALYLPGLGDSQIKGEEARRALPAVEMLRNGDWVVPRLNGVPYLRKPPLINWAIAASLHLTGEQTERSVRLPSVLAMLAMGLVIFGTGIRWLPRSVAWVAAVAALSGVGLWEKGRLAEIEALYVAFTGIAFAWWLAAWANRKSGFAMWLVPGLFLGLGLLTKGPTHLLLFYAVVLPILFHAREQRELVHPGHLAGLALAGLLFAAWIVPYLHATAALNVDAVWAHEVKQRVGGSQEGLGSIALDFLSALANGLPWILLAPLWWSRHVVESLEPRLALLVRAARWPLALGFVGLVLIPGMVARYTLPLYPAGALLLALVVPSVTAGFQKAWSGLNATLGAAVLIALPAAIVYTGPRAVEWKEFLPALVFTALAAAAWPRLSERPVRLAVGTAAVFAGAVAVFAAGIQPRLREMVDLRRAEREVASAVPADVPLYLSGVTCSPVLFYISHVRSCTYIGASKNLPPDARFLLLSGKKQLSGPLAAARLLFRYGGDKDTQMLLLELPK